MGTFAPVAGIKDASTSNQFGSHHAAMGLRRCPNPDCTKGVFVVYAGPRLLLSYPPEVLDVDTTNLPDQVLASLEEAVQCHSIGCFRAAAIMVRRTLEDVCADRGAKGDNLKERIKALGTTVVVPPELIDGLDELRLLGNDAAHVEAQAYNEVGSEEVELAIEVVKTLLLGVYQTAGLIERLRARKQEELPPTS